MDRKAYKVRKVFSMPDEEKLQKLLDYLGDMGFASEGSLVGVDNLTLIGGFSKAGQMWDSRAVTVRMRPIYRETSLELLVIVIDTTDKAREIMEIIDKYLL